MTANPVQKIPIQLVLTNVSDELFALSRRLQHVEEIIFDPKTEKSLTQNLEGMQDMDLIIQQIADLARAINCITEVELDDVKVGVSTLDDRLHLDDLRKRLLGASEDRLIFETAKQQDVLLF